MFSFRTRVILISSIFGVGCLVCAAALAFRRRRRLRARKSSKENLQRQLIASELKSKRKQRINRNRTRSTGNNNVKIQEMGSIISPATIDDEASAVVSVNLQRKVDGDEKALDEADLAEVVTDLRMAINQLETTLNCSDLSSENQLDVSMDESSIGLEIKRLQQLLHIASSEDTLSNINDDNAANTQMPCNLDDEDGYSSDDSFVSAIESIDNDDDELVGSQSALDELDTLIEKQRGSFYASAVDYLRENEVPVRRYRTAMMCCDNDFDFCAKAYCLRLAFKHAFSHEANRELFKNCGRSLITELLTKSDKDSKQFSIDLDALIEYCSEKSNWGDIDEELSARGVRCMSFFDIVLDFIVMDSLEDLDDPPYAVTTAIQNRWLSQSIKETALTTAIWSILTAKSRMLKNQDGFLMRMYAVSQHITPVLAWGLLGPVEELTRVCTLFKDGLIGYLQDIFNTDVVNYETLEQLANDVVAVARRRHTALCQQIEN